MREYAPFGDNGEETDAWRGRVGHCILTLGEGLGNPNIFVTPGELNAAILASGFLNMHAISYFLREWSGKRGVVKW